MTRKILIDASHPEETRLAILDGKRVEDFEAETRRQIRGNIYLARVTRVEPSLQAAFVDYGGNRHGFLAFSEIHPDYFQIPVADREALEARQREEEQAESAREEAETADEAEGGTAVSAGETTEGDGGEDDWLDDALSGPGSFAPDFYPDLDELDRGRPAPRLTRGAPRAARAPRSSQRSAPRRVSFHDTYKIQEVIRNRQVILIQAVREERGGKGAAMTSYLSLAGRYCVLMPNTRSAGGVSRRIEGEDRQRLKGISGALDVPEGMSLIVRTAGSGHSKPEIRRDFDYLLRLWENIRSLTLESTAPSLIYEEGNLVRRALRDLYGKNIEEVVIEGEEAWREARAFMRLLLPGHVKNIHKHEGPEPLFAGSGAEEQFEEILSPRVPLKSGGYLVINPTEALVAIDVNSGRATREHNIEETALKTNLEAAEELGRQLRLRDLAGLIVVDFIDMTEARHIRDVERRVRDCLKGDPARVQTGRISAFGLFEMSRQHLRPSFWEGRMESCPHCEGRGRVYSAAALTLRALRAVEKRARSHRGGGRIVLRVPWRSALYIFNHKREWLSRFQERHGVEVEISADPGHETLPEGFAVEAARDRDRDRSRGGGRSSRAEGAVRIETAYGADAGSSEEEAGAAGRTEEDESGRRRARRGRRGGRRRDRERDAEAAGAPPSAPQEDWPEEAPPPDPAQSEAVEG